MAIELQALGLLALAENDSAGRQWLEELFGRIRVQEAMVRKAPAALFFLLHLRVGDGAETEPVFGFAFQSEGSQACCEASEPESWVST